MEKEMSTYESILSEAKNEFLSKGFKDAKLRTIAKNAGVTTGALYRYFSSKEELFGALVSSAYCGLIDIYRKTLDEFRKLDAEEQILRMDEKTRTAVARMIDFVYENRDAMKLILCSSEGTEYSGLVHEMARMDTEATHDFASDTNKAGFDSVHLVDPRLEHMLMSGMFSMFFEVIVHDVEKKDAEDLIYGLLVFCSAGWRKLMGF